MVNGKATIAFLTVGMIKKIGKGLISMGWYKWLNIFQNQTLQEKEWEFN